MSRRWKALVLLVAGQAVLSGSAAVLEAFRSCGACGSGRLPLGVAGFVFYSILFGFAVARGPSRLFFSAVLLAFGVHAALAAQMVATGALCGLCLASAAGSLGLAGLSILIDRANLGRLALIVPWSALLVAFGTGIARPEPRVDAAATGAVSVVIFTEPDCPYCEELRTRVMPEIEREFGARVRIDYRPAADLPAVRRTPTMILTPGRVGARGRVIEGLPTLERLRGAIRDLETRS